MKLAQDKPNGCSSSFELLANAATMPDPQYKTDPQKLQNMQIHKKETCQLKLQE